MKKVYLFVSLFIMSFASMVLAEDSAFDSFLTKFDYETRADMKIALNLLLPVLSERIMPATQPI